MRKLKLKTSCVQRRCDSFAVATALFILNETIKRAINDSQPTASHDDDDDDDQNLLFSAAAAAAGHYCGRRCYAKGKYELQLCVCVCVC